LNENTGGKKNEWLEWHWLQKIIDYKYLIHVVVIAFSILLIVSLFLKK